MTWRADFTILIGMFISTRGRTRSRRGAASRAALERAAVRLIGEHGPAGATVDAVAEAAGVTKGSAYWHYADKDALVAAAAEGALEAWTTGALPAVIGAGSAAERVERLVWAHVRDLQAAGSPALCLARLLEDAPGAVPMLRRWQGRVRELVAIHESPGSATAAQLVGGLVAALVGLASVWNVARDRLALEAAAAGIVTAFTAQLTGRQDVTKQYYEVLSL